MAKQQLHGFGAFFFVTGVFLLIIAVLVGLTADEKQQVLVAGAMIAFAVAGSICFVAAAITLRLAVVPPRSDADTPRATEVTASKKEWPESPRDEGQGHLITKPGGKP